MRRQPVGHGRAAGRRHPLQPVEIAHRHDPGDQGNGHPRRPNPVAESQEGVDVEEELADRPGRPRIHLGLQHIEVMRRRRAFGMALGIAADDDVETAFRRDCGGQFGRIGVTVRTRNIGAADAVSARRIAAQGHDVAHPGVAIALDDRVDLLAAGLDTGQVGRRRQGRFRQDPLHRPVRALAGRTAGAIGDRDELGRQRGQTGHGLPQIGLGLVGLGRKELERHARPRRILPRPGHGPQRRQQQGTGLGQTAGIAHANFSAATAGRAAVQIETVSPSVSGRRAIGALGVSPACDSQCRISASAKPKRRC